ncbi:MAG: 50S ribosomal protein L13 [Syntrophus sp. (in: bacteria)]|nr:50S ribosomal protein L13 [Syntrophus sp. (in: bacteria)]
MKTYFPKAEDIAKKEWYLVDAEGATLGRLAAKLAVILRGKNKPVFTPHMDMGDFIVVVNAEKVKLTGRKLDQKDYANYSGYQGGLRVINARTLLSKKPEDLIMLAVRGMLPKNILGRHMLKKLKVYRGKEHPHKAQMPKVLE